MYLSSLIIFSAETAEEENGYTLIFTGEDHVLQLMCLEKESFLN